MKHAALRFLAFFGLAFIAGWLGSYVQRTANSNAAVQLQIADSGAASARLANLNSAPTSFQEASALSTPTVVFIKNESTAQYSSPLGWFWDFDPFGSRGPSMSTGSGVIVSADGYIVTNNHVIQGAEKLTVVLNSPKKEFSARVVGADAGSDLALLKIEASNLPTISFANSDELAVGDWVLAVGNPFNLTSTVTAGIVSAKGRNINLMKNQFPIESFIQTDAAINPGNSGGALVNAKGELVGINTAIQSNTGSYTGYGFAIPSNIVRKIVTDFIEKGEVQRGFVGMDVRELNADEIEELELTGAALRVVAVLEDGPAYKAGIRKGDVLTAVEGHALSGKSDYDEHLAYLRPGDELEIDWIRSGSKKTSSIALISKQDNQALLMKGAVSSDRLGADFQPLNASDLAQLGLNQGIRILNIRRGGAIAQMGLPNGFVVMKFNGQSFAEPEALISAMERATGRIQIQGKDPNGTTRTYSFFSY
jgi:Do/DeqQ family serine protease